jgi:hypothetical protein
LSARTLWLWSLLSLHTHHTEHIRHLARRLVVCDDRLCLAGLEADIHRSQKSCAPSCINDRRIRCPYTEDTLSLRYTRAGSVHTHILEIAMHLVVYLQREACSIAVRLVFNHPDRRAHSHLIKLNGANTSRASHRFHSMLVPVIWRCCVAGESQ